MKKVYLALSILILALIALSFYWQSTQANKAGITIDYNGETQFISLNKLNKMEHEKVVTTRDDKIFSGIKLAKILEKFPFEELKSLTFSSTDGMSVAIQKDEFVQTYLCEKQNGDNTYYQLVLINDAFGQRWLKYVNRITLK